MVPLAMLLSMVNRPAMAVPPGPARQVLAGGYESPSLQPLLTWGTQLQLEEPAVSGMAVSDFVHVSGRVSALADPYLWVRAEKQGSPGRPSSLQRIAVKDGRADGKVWLPFGAGDYLMTVWSPTQAVFDGRTAPAAGARWQVTNLSQADLIGLVPSAHIESDSPEITALAAAVTRGLTTPMEKARAVHDWVARNVSYDMVKFRGSLYTPDDGALKTLATKKGVCQDYTFLTVALLRAAGVKSREVVGKGRGLAGWGSHAWTEAWVNGRWLTMDTTWDAGFVDRNDHFGWQFSTRYFDPDPRLFALDHVAESYVE
jgi:hypothetical protein